MSAPSERYDSLFQIYAAWRLDADEHGTLRWLPRVPALDWTLLKSQAVAESNLDPDATSPVHAEGLTQFMQATFDEWLERKFHGPPPPRRHVTPFDPEDAIWAQADMMGWLLGVFVGDRRKALASYNAGLGRVQRLILAHGDGWEAALPDETKGYLTKVLGVLG